MTLEAIAEHMRRDRLPVVRTDFSDDVAWDGLLARLRAERLGDKVGPVEDRGFMGMNGFAFQDAFGGQMNGFVLLADAQAMREQAAGREVTVLFFDLGIDKETALGTGNELVAEFRCPVEHVYEVEMNLDLGNLDFDEFSDNVDDDGVFRQFG